MVATLEHLAEVTLPTRPIPAWVIVTARSYFIDRIKPDCEVITLSEDAVAGGEVRLSLGPVETGAVKRGRFSRLTPTRRDSLPEDRLILDLRRSGPDNWAHFLNNHLPYVFWAAETAKIDLERFVLLLPEDIPKHSQAAAAFFGLEVKLTDAIVTGRGYTQENKQRKAVSEVITEWAHLPVAEAALAAGLAAAPASNALPKKVFLARRKTRVLTNEAEIETVLTDFGFTKVYAEDYSVADQMRLFREAEALVAIHGAGLGPLLYCAPGQGPEIMIELLSPGHMTNVYRAIADAVGTRWIGVRGRLKPEYVKQAYAFDAPFRAFSLDDFEVDPASIERSFEILEQDI